MKKYGLQLRVQPLQQSKKPPKPPLPKPLGFGDEGDDDVEQEISRQATKNKSLKDIEEQHKRALQEDSTVFDYDGVYDQMKQQIARPRAQDREERKPKYIQALMKKAEQRQREHEIIYERKLAKERSQDDHLYADKDKFVTSAYKKKLAEQAKWMEEDLRRQRQEEKEDVTKKSDLTNFYFNLGKNVAFGSDDIKLKKLEKETKPDKPDDIDDKISADTEASKRGPPIVDTKSPSETSKVRERHQDEASVSETSLESADHEPVPNKTDIDEKIQENLAAEKQFTNEPKHDHHKKRQDALAAAKERFLARKKAKLQ